MAVACVAAMVAASGQLQAGVITADFTTTLVLSSGADTGGLNGATLSIHAEFDDAGVYVNLFGLPALDALIHTITISSASVPASNGVFSDPDGLTYLPTFANSFESNVGQFLAAGPLILVGMETGPGSVFPSIGDTISVDNFNTTSFDPRGLLMRGVDGSQYTWAAGASLTINGATTAVPEPSSLALFGIGACLAGIGAARRRQRAQKKEAVA